MVRDGTGSNVDRQKKIYVFVVRGNFQKGVWSSNGYLL